MFVRRTLALASAAASLAFGARPADAQSTAEPEPGFSVHYEAEPGGWLYDREAHSAGPSFDVPSYLSRRIALRTHDMRGVSGQFYVPIDRSAYTAMVDVAIVHGRLDVSDCVSSGKGPPRPAASGYCSRGTADAADWHAALNVSRAFSLASPISLDLAVGGGVGAFSSRGRQCVDPIDVPNCNVDDLVRTYRPQGQSAATLHFFVGAVGLSLRVSDAISLVSAVNGRDQPLNGAMMTSPRLPASVRQERSVGLGVYFGPRQRRPRR